MCKAHTLLFPILLALHFTQAESYSATDTLDLFPLSVNDSSYNFDSFQTSKKFNTLQLQNTAGTINDVNRVLATSISAQPVGILKDNSIFVRGGGKDENLYLLNGLEFENINHFALGPSGALGFVGVDVLDQIDFYTSTSPSMYPASSSSTIELDTRGGASDSHKQKVDLHLSGVGALVEGPMGDSGSTYLSQIRYVDARPVRSFITTGQVPQFMDFVTSLDLNHGNKGHSRLFGLVTWDWMEAYFSQSDFSQYNRMDRYAGSYSGAVQVGNLLIEGGFAASNASLETFWSTGKGSVSEHGSKLHLMEDYGKVFNHYEYTINPNLNLKFGLNFKYSHNREKRYNLNDFSPPSDVEINNLRSGMFTSLFLVYGKFNAQVGLRAEHFTAFSKFGFSPQLIINRKIGNLSRIEWSGGVKQTPPGSYFNILFRQRRFHLNDYKTLALRRLWHTELSYIQKILNMNLATTYYVKYYDREYKLVDGIEREDYAGQEIKNGEFVIVYREPDGKKVSHGVEIGIQNEVQKPVGFYAGLSIASVQSQYVDGEFYRDENDIRFSFNSSLFWEFVQNQMISVSLLSNQGRPYWSRDQVADKTFYSQRFPYFHHLSTRYTWEKHFDATSISFYFEIHNLLNQTPVVYQWGSEGRANGIFPVLGLTGEF